MNTGNLDLPANSGLSLTPSEAEALIEIATAALKDETIAASNRHRAERAIAKLADALQDAQYLADNE